MIGKDTDLVSLLEQALSNEPQKKFDEIGIVIKVGDGICKVYGLANVVFSELIEFEHGARGIVLNLDEDFVSIGLLENTIPVIEQETAHRTGNIFSIPVGDNLLGRVINALGQPQDGLGKIDTTQTSGIEKNSPSIIDRQPVNQPLETGVTVIDSLIPIGKGQRELFIGNRSTGKTSLVLDIILHQRGKNVICVYVAIGNKQANVARLIHQLEQRNALDYTIIVDASAKETALNQFLSPYVGCTIGEYFMKQGKDVLIVYDDLTGHAIAYRELSLLLQRPPGREAYPGDIFYVHSRLLERAGRLNESHGGGSLTALPIIQTQGDDISSYIPTNLISITDGQIFFDTTLFNQGTRPAVNIGLSISRVGGAAQTKARKKVCSNLRLELAQYNELLAFAQFGTELDKVSKKALDRGKRAIALFKQEERETHEATDQVIFLFLLKEDYLDKLRIEDIKSFSTTCASYIKGAYAELYQELSTKKDFVEDSVPMLKKAIDEFIVISSKPMSKSS